MDDFSCGSCNNYEDCSFANDNPELCSIGAGCCTVWNDVPSMDCLSCSDAKCYELESADCELNEECCVELTFIQGQPYEICRRCDNCTEGFVNYRNDSCSCLNNEDDCSLADIEYSRNCVWNTGNDTMNGTCSDRVIVPAPTYLGSFCMFVFRSIRNIYIFLCV